MLSSPLCTLTVTKPPKLSSQRKSSLPRLFSLVPSLCFFRACLGSLFDFSFYFFNFKEYFWWSTSFMLLAMETSGVGCLAISPRFLRKVRLDAELVMVSFAFAPYFNLYFPPGNQRQSMKVTIVLLCLTLSVVHILLLIHEPTQVWSFPIFLRGCS